MRRSLSPMPADPGNGCAADPEGVATSRVQMQRAVRPCKLLPGALPHQRMSGSAQWFLCLQTRAGHESLSWEGSVARSLRYVPWIVVLPKYADH